jgi:putative membrane protein
MLADAMYAWFHYLAIFVMVVVMTAEAVLLRADLTANGVKRLIIYDRLDGVSAILVLITGVLRLTLGAKGAAFYMSTPWFHAKITLFVIIALCSIPPTLAILRWAKQSRQNAAFVPPAADIKRARRWVMIESHLFIFLPLFAVLMARHISM